MRVHPLEISQSLFLLINPTLTVLLIITNLSFPVLHNVKEQQTTKKQKNNPSKHQRKDERINDVVQSLRSRMLSYHRNAFKNPRFKSQDALSRCDTYSPMACPSEGLSTTSRFSVPLNITFLLLKIRGRRSHFLI